ncbi:MAG: nucleotide exchange factor GrpE [Ureaplasma sp.]|nr:nucleotide exchange factor GrpE [Ureaplasma sp.]
MKFNKNHKKQEEKEQNKVEDNKELENESVLEDEISNKSQNNELSEIELLKKELESVKQENNNLQKELISLKWKIEENNQNYIKKLKEKQDEMQKILVNKQEELVALNNQKLVEFKTKLFTKDILDLIDTIEQFDKIINIPNDNPQIQNFLFGFKMFSNMFANALNNMGIEKISISVGNKPNHETMEVVEIVKDSNQEKDTITEIVSNGYKYKDNVIKFAKVKVKE